MTLFRARTFGVGVAIEALTPVERVISAALRLRHQRLYPPLLPPGQSYHPPDHERELFDALDALLLDELRHAKGVQYVPEAKP